MRDLSRRHILLFVLFFFALFVALFLGVVQVHRHQMNQRVTAVRTTGPALQATP